MGEVGGRILPVIVRERSLLAEQGSRRVGRIVVVSRRRHRLRSNSEADSHLVVDLEAVVGSFVGCSWCVEREVRS